MDVKQFKQLPILGILRQIEADDIEPLVEAVISGGLKTIEVTMNTKKADELIRRIGILAGKRLVVGAGTVLTIDEMRKARDAGASFIVTPCLVDQVAHICVKEKMPFFPGAFTPGEIYNAWCAGATMVKVFPAKFFGPDYIKEIKGPFQDIELLACGGVGRENIRSFFSSGASAAAFGASIFKKEWIKAGEFSRIESAIRELIRESGF